MISLLPVPNEAGQTIVNAVQNQTLLGQAVADKQQGKTVLRFAALADANDTAVADGLLRATMKLLLEQGVPEVQLQIEPLALWNKLLRQGYPTDGCVGLAAFFAGGCHK